MALASILLKKALTSSSCLVRNSNALVCAGVRNYHNTMYKPGPYPKTQAEREASAKKYGMSIEEYEPYPEDMGYGDYPKLPDIGAESKDDFYPYDIPEFKRNFNEPINARAEIFGEDRYNISLRPRFSNTRMWVWFLGVMTGWFTLYYIMEDYKMERPVIAKQLPHEGPHYTFA